MTSKRVTLRDIAKKCGVSTALVSAVLNRKLGKMQCSREKQELIQKTASELDYRANALARSIKAQNIPITGVFLRRANVAMPGFSNSTSILLDSLCAVLNSKGLEVLFVPFKDNAAQLKRMRDLYAGGFIGSIITNISPADHQEVCDLLKNSGIPYMILGCPNDKDVYSFHNCNGVLTDYISQLAEQQRCSRIFTVEPGTAGELIFRRMPLPQDYLWCAPELTFEQIKPEASDAFFAVYGLDEKEKLASLLPLRNNYVILEYIHKQKYIPADEPVIFYKSDMTATADYISEAFCNWVLHDQKPAKFDQTAAFSREDFILQNINLKGGEQSTL